MTWFLRSWTDRDVGADREISGAIYPEYLKSSGTDELGVKYD